jgi:hypothetical protein
MQYVPGHDRIVVISPNAPVALRFGRFFGPIRKDP